MKKLSLRALFLNSSVFRPLRLGSCPSSNLKLPKPFAISLYLGSTVINVWFLLSHRIQCLFWDVLHIPFQKIRSLFADIWTEHGVLIYARKVLNLVIKREGTWMVLINTRIQSKVHFKKKITFNLFFLELQVGEKMVRVFTILPWVHKQQQINCENLSIQVIVSCSFSLFYFHGHELGIIFSCSFSYTSMLFLQAVLNLSFFCWNIYAHICHTLSYLPSFIAARSPSLVSLNFKVLYPNHLIKPVFKIRPSAILAWSAWPLWTINYPCFIKPGSGFQLLS